MPLSSPSSKPTTRSRLHIRALVAVALGGLGGSAARGSVDYWLGAEGFPSAVLVVNLVGSFLLGLYLALRQRSVVRRDSIQFWAIGLLGSFTTFSAFAVDLVHLAAVGRAVAVGVYLVGSVVGGLILALVGIRIGRVLR